MIGSASKIDAASMEEELRRVLTPEEQSEQAYRVIRDYFVFTDKRLVLVNKRGITGKKVEYQSIPYKSITHFSVSTVGRFELDSELKIWIRGAAVPIQKRFSTTLSIHEVQRVLAGYVLG